MGLNKLEIRVLKQIEKSGLRSKSKILNFLRKELALPEEISTNIYSLWFLNNREDGKYEEITEPNRELKPFLNILKRVQSGELEPSDVPDKYYGKKLPECKMNSSYYSRSWSAPCVEFDKITVWLRFDRENFERPEISGLHEDDLWKYYEFNSSYRDYSEYFSSDEFNYFQYNDETLNLIKRIAINLRRKNVIDYLENDPNPESETLSEFLLEMIPEDKYNNIVNDYISEINYITHNVRVEETKKYYEEELLYPVDRYGDYYEIEIPLSDFINIVEKHNPFSFSDIITDHIELQPPIHLDDIWYDASYINSDDTSHIDELNRNLEKIVDDFDENAEDKFSENLIYFDNIIKNTGLEFIRKNHRKEKEYLSKDGRLELNSGGINLYDEKITFRYDGEKHTVPLDNFVNWAQGSVLDLKNESVRYGNNRKTSLREGKKTITKISIFDFDGTLADTPSREDGIPIWEAKTGEEYPHKGWYSKRESLDENIFKIKLIASTVSDYVAESKNPNTLLIMLTGRMPNQADQVESILSNNGIVFEEYHYKERGDTFTSKINTIKKLISQNPNVSQIEMWEDRLNHADGFEQWGKENGADIRVNRVS